MSQQGISSRSLSPRWRHAHGLSSMLCVLAIVTSLAVHTRGQASYSGLRSYAKYPEWDGLNNSDGLVQVVFRTSVGNGLLFYAQGRFELDAGVEALEVRLDEGRVIVDVQRRVMTMMIGDFVIRESRSERLLLSENLNDNEQHTLTLRQAASQFTVDVDSTHSLTSSLLGTPPSPIGSQELYIGGIPETVTSPFSSGSTVPFKGCLDSVKFARNSSDPASLVSTAPVSQEGVMDDGCLDPCTNGLCGMGACVALLPGNFFCDCSGTDMGGVNCSEDLSAHRLNLTLDTYLCYDIAAFPLVSRDASVRLVPPLPASGTIMTGVSATNDHFELYLENGVLKFNQFYYNKSRVQFKSAQSLDTSLTYQIDLQLERNQTQMTLSTVAESQLTQVDQWTENLKVSVSNGVQESICVGGSTVHVPYYNGLVERVIFNRVPLSDQRFVGQASVEEPTHVISFRRELTDPPLVFDTMTFENYMQLSFEVRMRPNADLLSGTPLTYGKDGVEIGLLVFNRNLIVLSTNSLGFFMPPCFTSSVIINDNEWHHVEVTITRNNNGIANLRVVLDNDPSIFCETDTEDLRATLTLYLNTLANMSAPVNFGVPVLHTGSNGIVNFEGCIKNIEFRETLESIPVRLDLGGVIRTEERFTTGEDCYSCSQQGAISCTEMDACADCGFFSGEQCLSPGSSCPRDLPFPTTTTMPPSSSTSSTSTPPPVFTTPSPLPTTTTTTTTEETSETESPASMLTVGAVAGIAVGGAALLVVLVVVAIVLLYVCLRQGSGKQGFYKTEESNGKVASMVHFSASLRQISSEQVTVPEKNGVSPMHADGLRPKEFYL